MSGDGPFDPKDRDKPEDINFEEELDGWGVDLEQRAPSEQTEVEIEALTDSPPADLFVEEDRPGADILDPRVARTTLYYPGTGPGPGEQPQYPPEAYQQPPEAQAPDTYMMAEAEDGRPRRQTQPFPTDEEEGEVVEQGYIEEELDAAFAAAMPPGPEEGQPIERLPSGDWDLPPEIESVAQRAEEYQPLDEHLQRSRETFDDASPIMLGAEEAAYQEPAYQEPDYQEPAYQEPAYQEPAYQEPAYQEPAYQEPAYQEPVAAAPAEPPPAAPQISRTPPPPIDPLPLDKGLPEGENTWLTNYQIFKAVSQKLARVGDWRKLAAITGHALLHAPYAARMTRTGMLLDLARIYRDRLHDDHRAEQAFAVLAHEDPASAEAIEYLVQAYERRAEWEAIYDIYLAAVEATWDPNDRLSWTRQAAELARSRLQDESLAIRAWEHLWRLGDAAEEAYQELTRLYRRTGRWAEMAGFLQQQADRLEGADKLVVLRELTEVKLSGLQDPDGASQVLEQIVAGSPQDPIATLQLARVSAQRKDYPALVRLGHHAASEEVPPEAAVDLQHLVADALWHANRLEEAVQAYDRILQVDPTDYDGNRRKQEFLTQTRRFDELLDLVIAEADSTTDERERGELLAKAAILAEEKLGDPAQAVTLWESRIALDPEHLPAFEALTRLCDAMGDNAGVARALEGQLALTKETKRRIELLRRLGQHYAVQLGQDEKAEACWKEILSLDPSDLPTREELIKLHRRRGDFESLNSALLRQIWLTADDRRAEMLCRLAAENLDENFDDPARSIDAWQRVLDFAPMDLPAFQALKKHTARLEQRQELIATLEREIRAIPEEHDRIERSLQIARLWEEEGDPKGAAACYERILRWDAVHPESLEGLFRIYGDARQQGKAAGGLEHASALIRDPARRVELLRGCLELLPADDHFTRFFLLRRILFLAGGDRSVVEELKAEAEAAGGEGLWHELAAILTQLACTEDEVAPRIQLHRELAWLHEKKLSSPVRSYLALQGVLLSPEHQEEMLEEVSRLAKRTKRHEDLLAVLECLTTPQFDLAKRKEVIAQRAAICEKDINSPLRAFHEMRRLLELDPDDWSPLEELERLAGEHGLWRELDAVLAELWDRATLGSERMELLARRERVAREKLDNRAAAFDLLIRRFRLDPENLELLKQLTEDAEALGGWDWLLPTIEATQLSSASETAATEQAVTAALYEQKLQDKDRAFALYGSAFTRDPEHQDLADKLEQLAADTGRFETLANTFREAAAVSSGPEQTIDLLRRTARIYELKLDAHAKAIEIHRRLLHLKEDEMPSLELVIEWHRDRKEWRDLRDRLHQWIRLAPADQDRLPKLLEIAQISEQSLDDPECALETYGEILELEPEHEGAKAGLKGLVVSIAEPSMRLRWLRMELKGVEPDRAVELQLEIAKLQEEELEDLDGAIATLRELTEEAGPEGPGFEPLSRLLRQTKQWKELTLLLQSASGKLDRPEAKLAALDEAIDIYHEHLVAAEEALGEELYRALLERRPADLPIRVRLARLLRQGGRFEELCQLLEENLQHLDSQQARVTTLYELARLQSQNLNQLDQAKASWQRILDEASQEEGAILGLAWVAAQQEDIKAYVAYRKQQAHLLPPGDGALVLCHLAEVCDEHAELSNQMVPFYREARRMDPNNVPAMEALKGIGRRLKTLRPAAALLPLEGERDLEPAERAKRLRALGDGAIGSEPRQALEWYARAVAMDPDDVETWGTLTTLLERLGEPAAAFRAKLGWLHALERCHAVDAQTLALEAERFYHVAQSARTAGEIEAYKHFIHHAHDLVPKFAPAALAAAQTKIEDGDTEGAHALLHTVLTQHHDELNDEQRMRAYFSRGLTLRQLGRPEEATADLREALHLNALHADALITLGEIQAEGGRYAAALEHQIRALVVMEDAAERAGLYHRLGVLWEDGLKATAEAGACYELALAGGVTERDLLHRTLRHLQRTGRLDESLEVVDNLLPTSQDPDELATLWLVRGEIFAAREGQEDQAIEAFDMALSYDPGRQEAREGLTMVLERRGDWQQLLQVLEASLDVAGPEHQSQALRRMADICSLQLGDQQRAEQYLRQSVEIFPTREALEYLEQLYTVESGRVEDRKEVVGLLVGFGPPWFERCMELATMLLSEEKSWAWCLLSPLLGVSQVDPDLKAVVQAMRKEYERPPVLYPGEEDGALVVHPGADWRLTEVLAQLGEYVRPLGLTAVEQAGDGGAIAISENTNMGKIFASSAEGAGLPGCTLHRTQTLPEAVQVINSEPEPAVVVRTEVIQQLVHAEVGFFFAYALELARPGHRVMAALPAEERASLVPALWDALGLAPATNAAAKELAERIRDAVDEETRAIWIDTLEELAQQDPVAVGERWWNGVGHTARRAGLVAGADLRQVFRVMSRLEADVPRPRVVARLDELDEYVAGSEMLQQLVAFAASPAFGQILRRGKAIVET